MIKNLPETSYDDDQVAIFEISGHYTDILFDLIKFIEIWLSAVFIQKDCLLPVCNHTMSS